MFDLSMPEILVFFSVVAVYVAAGIIGILQLRSNGYKHLLPALVSLGVTLEAVILIFRAVAIKAVPLTGLFESMVLLTMVFGLSYLSLNVAIRQVWFSSVMVWVILAMILMTGAVAEPASEPHVAAATPWAIAHGTAIVLGGASITFATATAFLYLLGTRKLKRKEVSQVLGKIPNIERLERLNLFGIRAGFVLITIGLISGFGLIWFRSAVLEMRLSDWLADSKSLCTIAAWVLLGVILALNRLLLLKGKSRAYMTIGSFALVLFAILGVTILGLTRHDFASRGQPASSIVK